MAYKTILVHVDESERCQLRVDVAAKSQENQSHT
jgi:nucleotide-binding universal stress UspA family protein